MKIRTIVSALIVVSATVLHWRHATIEPTEQELLSNFQEHHDAFEQLRAMLEVDQQVSSISTTRVNLFSGPFGENALFNGRFPLRRFLEYRLLFFKTGVFAISRRSDRDQSTPCFYVWELGWAGEFEHDAVCWMEKAPSNLVANLDTFDLAGDYWRNHSVYRRIDSNWYLQKN